MRILIADDHALVRHGISAILCQAKIFKIVAEAVNGRQALQLAISTRPDVVLMDIGMPELNGIDATEEIRKTCRSTRIIMVSKYSTMDFVHRALRAGAHGYVAKSITGPGLIEAIKTVVSGHRYLGEGISESLLDHYLRAESIKSPLDQLSLRERQILQLLAEGGSTVSIAKALSLSPSTVDTYRSRLMRKLGIQKLPALIRFAIESGVTLRD